MRKPLTFWVAYYLTWVVLIIIFPFQMAGAKLARKWRQLQ